MFSRLFSALSKDIPKELLGMACAFIAYICFTLQDAVISVTARAHPPLQMIWLNSLVVFVLLTAVVYLRHGWQGLKAIMHTHELKLHLLRGFILAIGIVLALTAVSKLPLPNFYVIIFMSPLLGISLSGVLLREPVGWRKGLCVVFGFAGLIYALKPDVHGFDTNSFYAIAAALLLCTTALLTRFLGRKSGASILVFYPNLLVVILLALPVGFLFQPLRWDEIGYVVLAGTFSVLAFFINSNAYRLAPLYLTLPFQFLQFIWGAVAQWVLHNTAPSIQIMQGAAIVIGSNLVLLFLQRRSLKQRPVSAKPIS